MAPIGPSRIAIRHFGNVPIENHIYKRQATISRPSTNDWRAVATDEDLVIESWSQGFIVGALLIMACVTIANMRRGIPLHKLILIELLLAMSHGTFCFMTFNGYGWYLSATASLLYLSWIIHNIVSWLKVRPFFTHPGGFFPQRVSVWVKRIYLVTLTLSVPIITFQISDNFRFFNNRGGWYVKVRPYEPLMRDPWWVFTALTLFHVIRKCYGTGVVELIRRSPRFGILLSAICLSIVFTACDIAASIAGSKIVGSTEGINPWWKLSLVFKCLTDTIMLDDFKTELKRLGIKRIVKEEKRRNTISLVPDRLPLDGQDEESGDGGVNRRSIQWYRSGQSPQESTACDISPTTSILAPNKLSYGDHNNGKQQPLNSPDATIEELEFSTALSLDPSRVSGVESVGRSSKCQAQGVRDRDQQERDSFTSHTKRISRLPSLSHWHSEAIKPGKKSNASGSKSHPDQPTQSHPQGGLSRNFDRSKEAKPDMEDFGARPSRNIDFVSDGQIHDLRAGFGEACGARGDQQYPSQTAEVKTSDVAPENTTDSDNSGNENLVRRFKVSIGA